MITVCKSVANAEAQARSILTIIDASFAALPSPISARANATAGELLVAAKSSQIGDPK